MQISPILAMARQDSAALIESLNEARPHTSNEVAGIFNTALQKLEAIEADEAERQPLIYDVRLWFLTTRTVFSERESNNKKTPLSQRFAGWEIETYLPEPSLSHFAQRYDHFSNPYLKARYADFLATRSREGDAVGARHWVQKAVPCYLQSVPLLSASPKVGYQIEAFKSLDSAAHLATSKAHDLLPDVVAALSVYLELAAKQSESSDGQEVRLGRWTVEVGWILLNLREQNTDWVSNDHLEWWEEQAIDLARRNAPHKELFLEQSFWSQAAEAAKLRRDEVTRFSHLRQLAEAKVREARARTQEPGASFLAAATLMENAVDYYDRLRSHDVLSHSERTQILEEIRQLKLEIRHFYREGEKEIGIVSTPLNVSPEQIEETIAPFLEPPTLQECLQRLGASLLPNPQSAEQWADSRQEDHSLMSLLGTSYMGDGMNIGSYNSKDEKRKFELNRALDFEIYFHATLLLPRIFKRLRTEKSLSPDALFDYLSESGSIESDNLPLVEKGIKHYFAQDYVSALHLLVPQLEDIMRHLFERAGLPPAKLTDQKANAWQFETMGALLKRADEELSGWLPRELRLYVERTLCDGTGWNLRNNIAHGMIKLQQCNQATTETVLHLYLSFALFQEINQLEEEHESSATLD